MNRRLHILGILSLVVVLTACATTEDAFVRNLQSQPARYSSLADLPYEPIRIGDDWLRVVDDLEIAQFPWGKSRFLAIELPASEHPYYLVVKSYLVSPFTHLRYGYTRGGDNDDPWVFFPRLTLLDEKLNVTGQSRFDDFQLKSNIRFKSFVIASRPAGTSWLQAAFRIDPNMKPAPRFVIVSTASDIVGKVGAIPASYWPFGPTTAAVFMSGGIPVLVPMPSYRGPMRVLHYANIGELQIHAVEPKDLLRTTFGKSMEPSEQREPVVPGETFEKRGLRVRTPRAAGYEVADRSTANSAYFVFSKDLPDGRGKVIVFAQLYRPGTLYLDLDRRVETAIQKEYETFLTDISFQIKDISLMGTACKRIDFTGRQQKLFLAPFIGYDIHCIVEKNAESPLAVRIGGNIVTNPAFTAAQNLPAEAEDFIYGISYQGRTSHP